MFCWVVYLHYPKYFQQCLSPEKSTSLLKLWAHFIITATSRTGNLANETKLKGALCTEIFLLCSWEPLQQFKSYRWSPKEEDADVSEGWWKYIRLGWLCNSKQKNAVALTVICLQYDTVLLSCFQRRTGMERSSTGDINTQSDRPDCVSLCVWHTLIDSHTHETKRLA